MTSSRAHHAPVWSHRGQSPIILAPPWILVLQERPDALKAVSPVLFLQPVIRYQPAPPGPQGHQPHGHILCHSHRVTLGNKHESTSSMNAKRSSKAACKFSAVSSCFLIWLAPSPPGNLPLNLRLRSGVRSLLWSSPKASPLSNKCFFSKSKKETLDFSEQNLFIPSLSISFLFHNVFREYVWVRENFGSSTWRINHRIH